MSVLVTGATGGLGGGVVAALAGRVPVVALARDPSRVVVPGVEVRTGSYEDRTALVSAFAGIETVLLVSAPAFTDRVGAHRTGVAAAAEAGVERLVYTAIQHEASFAVPQVTREDAETVALLRRSAPRPTVLWNTFYLDSVVELFGDGRLPAGDGVAALATRADIASATAEVLVSGDGRDRVLAGSRLLSMHDVAAALGRTYTPVSVDQYVSARVSGGMPEPVARFTASWFEAVAAGEFAAPGEIESLTGAPPTGVGEFRAAG